MLLSKEELIKLAEARENDELHQSKLFDSKTLGYDYELFHKKTAFKIKVDNFYVIISTNDDRNPIYRFRFTGPELQDLLDKAKNKDGSDSEFIKILFKDGSAYWLCGNKDPLNISNYLY